MRSRVTICWLNSLTMSKYVGLSPVLNWHYLTLDAKAAASVRLRIASIKGLTSKNSASVKRNVRPLRSNNDFLRPAPARLPPHLLVFITILPWEMRNTAMQKNNYASLFLVYTIQATKFNILFHVYLKLFQIVYIFQNYKSNFLFIRRILSK